jgi:excisionase family DNA binding protein
LACNGGNIHLIK